jgi:hypothetical protein
MKKDPIFRHYEEKFISIDKPMTPQEAIEEMR